MTKYGSLIDALKVKNLGCQSGWVDGSSYNLGCLYFHSVSMTPIEGEQFCQNKLNGSYLVEIYDSSQQNFIKQKLSQIGGNNSWWTGLEYKNGEYLWRHSNQKANYVSWSYGGDTKGGSSYSGMMLYKNSGYDWYYTYWKYNYVICQIKQ